MHPPGFSGEEAPGGPRGCGGCQRMAGKTSLPASALAGNTELAFCAGLLSIPLLNKDLQPPKISTANLLQGARAAAAGIGSEGGVGDGSGTQSTPDYLILLGPGDYLTLLGRGGSNCRVALPGCTWRVQLMNRSALLAAG